MRQPHVPPLDSAREFRVNEAFFSCTDARGIVLAGNRVFARVSGYSESELIGQPHNIIRHPDMPRAVFKLLWDTLAAGHVICAYVKNMAKDGRYYWVLALVAPMPGGFISIRFKPSNPLRALVESIYRDMRRIEIEAEARGDEGREGMALATAHLAAALSAHGFADYDAFMRSALLRSEVKSRDEAILHESLYLFEPLPPIGSDPLVAALHAACAHGQEIYATLREHLDALEEFADLDQKMIASSKLILSHSTDIDLVAFNLALWADKLGYEGQGITVIAGFLNDASVRIKSMVDVVTKHITLASEKLSRVLFHVAWLRLQFEMVVVYFHEIARELGTEGTGLSTEQLQLRLDMLGNLRAAIENTSRDTVSTMEELAADSRGLTSEAESLYRVTVSLQVAQVGGLVEAGRLADDGELKAIFDDVRNQVEHTSRELRTLTDVAARLETVSSQTPMILECTRRGLKELGTDCERLKSWVEKRGSTP